MKFGKSQAVERAYKEYSDAIYRFLYWQSNDSELAEDLTSEVFIRAWDHAELFEDADAQPQAWLYTVARNLLTDHWRKKRPARLDDVAEPLADIDISEAAALAEDKERVLAAITKLEARSQLIITLRFLEHLPVREVAGIMQLSEANVRTMQFRALKELKKLLQ